jgi:hypothetical protein
LQTENSSPSVSRFAFWAGWAVSIVPALFLLLDGSMKVVKPAFVVEKTTELGYSENVIVPLGIVLLICTVLYLFPRTSILGAILLTGYLGGAVASHVHHQDPLWQALFPVVFGGLIWSGLVLRNPRLRSLIFG